jgi:hypothetical protein
VPPGPDAGGKDMYGKQSAMHETSVFNPYRYMDKSARV